MAHLLSSTLAALMVVTSPSPPAATPSHAPVRVIRRINLNTATSRDLRKLPGVGELLAQRIIAARPLRSVESLCRVKGITPAHCMQLCPLVTI